jgi:hypothetical protein
MKSNIKPSGYLLHESTIDGKPYIAIATLNSENRKTGDMVQIWFLLRDVSPVDAVQSGLDASTVCKDCPFASGNGCYVNVGQAPLSVWRGFHRGIYPVLNPVDYSTVFAGRKIRFGAYGNPSLLPVSIVKAIASVSAGWTGYFHDWKTNPFAAEYAKYFMASTETESSFRMAQSLGFRTFHASPVQPVDSMECLSETKGIACAVCKLCAGLSKARLPSIWINPHGSKTAKANAVALSN